MSLFPYRKQSGLFVFSQRRRVLDCLVDWGNESVVGRAWTYQEMACSLERGLELVDDRKFRPDRAILIDFVGGCTAFFNNHSYEYLAQSELFVLCERLSVATCFFSHNDNPTSPQCGSSHFCYFRPTFRTDDPTVYERQVMVYKENGWTFSQNGEALPFERVDRYSLRKKSDRLNAELLREYGEAIGVRFWDPEAYGKEVSLLRWNTK